MEDKRNVIDKYKGIAVDEIVKDLDAHGTGLEIAIENLERDFNMGTIVRNANAFGARHLHVIGRKQWNKRGAMMTDKYLHVQHHETIDGFLDAVQGKKIYAIDNVENSVELAVTKLEPAAVLVFGSEGSGLSEEMLSVADKIVAIEQFGSTRSLNVGVAAGVVMYEWLRQNYL